MLYRRFQGVSCVTFQGGSLLIPQSRDIGMEFYEFHSTISFLLFHGFLFSSSTARLSGTLLEKSAETLTARSTRWD